MRGYQSFYSVGGILASTKMKPFSLKGGHGTYIAKRLKED